MSCSPFDLRDYFLKELAASEQSQVEVHLKTCLGCREDLEGLRLTEAALFSLREEEIPQRIAFVSDKIFEPSPWRRAWTVFWGSGARLSFAGAGMLSAAILVSALTRPVPIVQAPLVTTAATMSPVISEAGIQARIDAAVLKSVGAAEARQIARSQQLVADLEAAQQRLLLAADDLDRIRKRDRVAAVNARYMSRMPDGGVQ